MDDSNKSDQVNNEVEHIFDETANSEKKSGNSAKEYDHLFKLLSVGDNNSEKTTFMLRFADELDSMSFVTTIGVDFKIKTIELDGKLYKIQFWDTAGQERFRTITSSYYRGAHGILIMCAVDDRNQFDRAQFWHKEICKYAREDIQVFLVGTKADSEDRVVTREEGEDMAKSLNIPYYECSAKTGENVEEIVLAMICAIRQNMPSVGHPVVQNTTTTTTSTRRESGSNCIII
jgi:small GTP-binding protein